MLRTIHIDNDVSITDEQLERLLAQSPDSELRQGPGARLLLRVRFETAKQAQQFVADVLGVEASSVRVDPADK